MNISKVAGARVYSPYTTPKPLYFGDEAPVSPAPKKQPKAKGWQKLLIVTPLLKLSAAVCLITSALMPAPAKKAPELNPTPVVSQIQAQAPEEPADLKEILSRTGWALVSVSLVTGFFNGVSLSYASKEPTMMLANFAMLVLAPIQAYHPVLNVRAMVGLFGALWGMGYATTLRNQFNLKPGETPRQLDMAVLIDKEALKKAAALTNDAKTSQLAKAWLKELSKVPPFIAGDVKLAVTRAAGVAKEAASHPVQTGKDVAHALSDLKRYIKDPTSKKPDFLNPSSTQFEIATTLNGVLGQTPLIFLGDSVPAVTRACLWLSTMGSLSSNTSLAATAIHEKDKLFLAGIPVSMAGNLFSDTDGGAGLFQLGQTPTSNYFRKLNIRQAAEQEEKELAAEDKILEIGAALSDTETPAEKDITEKDTKK